MTHDSTIMLHGSPTFETELVLMNNITEALYLQHFPLPYDVVALTPWEVSRLGLDADIAWWRYQRPFIFVSDTWGPIAAQAGRITDFASVPRGLRNLYDVDSPILLRGSSPHDLLFEPRADGTRGWLPDGRRLSLRQVNEVLAEAMWYCGASERDRSAVFLAVEVGNHGIRSQFAPEDAAS